MKDVLKLIVFLRAKAEIDTYCHMKQQIEGYVGEGEGYTGEEIEQQRTRFLAVWQIIEEAKLEDEYEAWKQEIIEGGPYDAKRKADRYIGASIGRICIN